MPCGQALSQQVQYAQKVQSSIGGGNLKALDPKPREVGLVGKSKGWELRREQSVGSSGQPSRVTEGPRWSQPFHHVGYAHKRLAGQKLGGKVTDRNRTHVSGDLAQKRRCGTTACLCSGRSAQRRGGSAPAKPRFFGIAGTGLRRSKSAEANVSGTPSKALRLISEIQPPSLFTCKSVG